MDYTDFDAMARSYDYNPAAFLIALRRAGLTSLALTEELGANVGDDGNAYATAGAALINQSRISPIRDPLLARLVRDRQIKEGAVYLLVFDPSAYHRYRTQLALHFMPRSVRVLRATRPWLIEVRTQIDYFNAMALGIPTGQIELARRLALLVVPRFQNDERLADGKIDALFGDVLRYDPKVSTAIFFGLTNQVVGYPDHLEDTAAAFKRHSFNFGSIETYDPSQVQKGNDTLARLIPGRTVRVQAIAKTELDKLKLDEVVARYVLGVRERNVRVVYLRPWGHQDGALSIEATNVEMVKAIADELKADGFRLGRATPIPLYRGNNRILVGLAALAVPSIFVLLLELFGWYRRWLAVAAYGLTIALYLAGALAHHDAFARSAIALAGALLFATAALLVLIPAWNEVPAARPGTQFLRSLGWTLAATGVALLGALIVVGVLSTPLTMEEIERFRGVRLILALPPLIALVPLPLRPALRFGSAGSARHLSLAGAGLSAAGGHCDRRARRSDARSQRQRQRRLAVVIRARAAPSADARAERAPAIQRVPDRVPGDDAAAGAAAGAPARRRLAARARHRRRHRRCDRHLLAPPHAARNLGATHRQRVGDRSDHRNDRDLGLSPRRPPFAK